jgi:hypothetical protein
LLFAERDQEVLGQAPVEKRPGRIDRDDLQKSEFPGPGPRFFRRGDQPVLRVEIEEDLELVARRGSFLNIAAGEEDLAELAPVQVDAEVDRFGDR